MALPKCPIKHVLTEMQALLFVLIVRSYMHKWQHAEA